MDKIPKDEWLSSEETLERLRQQRLKLREQIKGFIEEELGRSLNIEEDLNEILKNMTEDQRQNIYGKIALAQRFQGN